MTLDDLLADFPPTTTEAWRTALAADLKGADPAKLDWPIGPGVTLPPFVRAGDVEAETPLLRRLAALLPDHPPELREWRWDDEQEDEDGGNVARYEEAGVDVVESLAFALRYEALTDPLNDERTSAWVAPVGPNVLVEAAKLRALRLLAGRLRGAHGLDPRVEVHAVTSRFWMTRVAPHTNLLRATLGAVAAHLGRADALTVRPHDLLTGPIEHGQRIAANVPRLLVHEGLLTDEFAQGAYTLDLLTTRLARAAWARFQEVVSWTDEQVAEACAASAKALFERVESGRLGIVGVNRYASPDDRVGELDDVAITGTSAHLRAALPVERYRSAVEAAVAEHGAPPVALLRFGDPALGTARATFVRGLLAVAGLSATETTSVEEAEVARLVVLCADDAAYPASGRDLARTLAASCAPPTVFVAGPEDATLRAGHVHGFVHARLPLLTAVRALVDAAFAAAGAPNACAV